MCAFAYNNKKSLKLTSNNNKFHSCRLGHKMDVTLDRRLGGTYKIVMSTTLLTPRGDTLASELREREISKVSFYLANGFSVSSAPTARSGSRPAARSCWCWINNFNVSPIVRLVGASSCLPLVNLSKVSNTRLVSIHSTLMASPVHTWYFACVDVRFLLVPCANVVV